MANLLVYIEPPASAAGRSAGCVPGALQALAEGRRLASALGARLHAFVPLPRAPGDDALPDDFADDATMSALDGPVALQALIETLSRHGADHVVLAPVPPGPPLWTTHGAALVAVCQRLQPLLVLVAASPAGRDLAPRLAAHTQAAFLAEPMLALADGADVLVSRSVYGPGQARRLTLEELDRPCVITLAAGRHRAAHGDGDAYITTLERAVPAPGWDLLGSEPDPGAALDPAVSRCSSAFRACPRLPSRGRKRPFTPSSRSTASTTPWPSVRSSRRSTRSAWRPARPSARAARATSASASRPAPSG